MRFPRKSTPDKTSSVVEVAPNVVAIAFAIVFLLLMACFVGRVYFFASLKTAPTGAVDPASVMAPQKRCPDTNLEFFSKV
jgi:hypothetical protein